MKTYFILKVTKDYNLAILYPKLAKEWHLTKNRKLKPTEVGPKSIRLVWWICAKGHEWNETIKNRVNGSGCPVCFLQNITQSLKRPS